jgi:hypothetical protein
MWKELVVAHIKYYLSIHLEKLVKTTKNFSQDSECPERDSNQAPDEHNSEALSADPASSVNVRSKDTYTSSYSLH